MNLRKEAKGKECQIRLPCCNGNPETTVLCHYRLIGVSGIGLKSPDEIAAWGCSDCHDAVDRRGHMYFDFDFVRLAHAEGCFRTQAELIKMGLVKW